MKPAQSKAVLTAIKAGDLLAVAASKSGVDPATVRRWRRRGRDALDMAEGSLRAVPKADRPFARFSLDADRELAIVEAALLAEVRDADDWRSSAWVLEKRWPDRYAPVTKVSVTAGVKNDAATALLQLLEDTISPSAMAEVIAALSGEEQATALRRPTVLMLAPGSD